MRSIFLCEKKENIPRIYRDVIERLPAVDEEVYGLEDVLAREDSFSDVNFIFSTWGMPTLTEEQIARCFPSLECVFYAAGTVQSFARPFLARGVKVFSAWAANAIPVAEMTVSEIILANKGFFRSARIYSESDKRTASRAIASCRGNYGETVGIIGAGMIGRLVIEMLRAYRLRVIVFDPFLSDERASELGVEKCDLPTLFERAFVVSNHLANNAETRGMLTYEHFCRMRENAVFLNTGRGAQVVEEDLVRILREREDLTAILDVTSPEPPVEGHPFYTLKNCILTPHIAGSAGDEVRRMGQYMLDECEALLSGRETRYEVTEKMLETMA